MRPVRYRWLAWGAAAVGGAAILAAGWLFLLLALPVGKGPQQGVIIGKDASLRYVAHSLKQKGLIRSEIAFRLAAHRRWKQVRQGEYLLSPSMNALDIMGRLAGGHVYAHWVTVPEGFTISQIADLLAERGIASRDEFLAAATAGRMLASDFPLRAGSLEGYLFPDTYRLLPGPEASQILVAHMVARFDEVVWKGLLQGRPPQGGLTLHELVILASLVEGEAKKEQERGLIAGVLMNRLSRGMKLQCDATVQYALGQRKPRLMNADLQVVSPYNTYLHEGLPPGPINNPGLASIRAAMHPQQTDFLYYVARPDGGHIFSRTLDQHNASIMRVRRGK
jgi:UPF0755 protein